VDIGVPLCIGRAVRDTTSGESAALEGEWREGRVERVGFPRAGRRGCKWDKRDERDARLRRYAFREDQHWSASVNCGREDCHYGRIHLANGATHHFIISTSPGTLLELGTLVLYVCIMLYERSLPSPSSHPPDHHRRSHRYHADSQSNPTAFHAPPSDAGRYSQTIPCILTRRVPDRSERNDFRSASIFLLHRTKSQQRLHKLNISTTQHKG